MEKTKEEDDAGLLAEVRDITTLHEKMEREAVPIINDGSQLSIKIPKRFAKTMGFTKEGVKCEFVFELRIPARREEPPTLTGHARKKET